MLNMPDIVAEGSATRMAPGDGAEPALRIRGLWKSFGRFVALRDIDLDVEKGEFLCFLGPSGCGKTTLLRAIAGLDPHDRGTIHQAGRDISRLPVGRRDFGIVFQSYALFPNLSVAGNVGYGLLHTRLSKDRRRQRVAELLAMVGLESQAAKYPAQLSGGQQQRVALARALAPSPGLLLLDEPLSALDAQVRLHLRDQLRQLQRSLGVTTIMVTHDQDEALATADRVVVMNQGRIEQIGTPEEVFARPVSAFVAGFLGDMNFVPGTVTGAGIQAGSVGLSVAQAAARAIGDRVSLCIRPSDVVVAADPGAGANRLRAQVTGIAFRGNCFRIALHCPEIGATLDAEVPANAWRGLELASGSPTLVALPEPKLHVFPEQR